MKDNILKIFDSLVSSNYRKIKCFVYSILQDNEEAKDVVQDVFYDLWNNMQIIENDNIESYLFISARWKCLNILKKRKLERIYGDFAKKRSAKNELGEILADNFNTDLLSSEVVHIISSSLKKMPEKTREVFCMHKFNNLSYKDIAAKQKCSVKNIEYRMMCALRILRENLKDYMVLFLGLFLALFL